MIPSAVSPDAQALNGKIDRVLLEKTACARREKVDGFGLAVDASSERGCWPAKFVAARRFSLGRGFLVPELVASG